MSVSAYLISLTLLVAFLLHTSSAKAPTGPSCDKKCYIGKKPKKTAKKQCFEGKVEKCKGIENVCTTEGGETKCSSEVKKGFQCDCTLVRPTCDPIPTFRPPETPRPCTQVGCTTIDGQLDYTTVFGNLIDDVGDCSIQKTSTKPLDVPQGALIKEAFLTWGAVGEPASKSDATITVNDGKVIQAERFKNVPSRVFTIFTSFYVATTNVTALVQDLHTRKKDFSVSSMFYFFNDRQIDCNYVNLAAWNLVIIYDAASLPFARINFCAPSPRLAGFGTAIFSTNCVVQNQDNSSAKTTLVAYGGDAPNEELFINDKLAFSDGFKGATDLRMDIVDLDIGKFITPTDRSLKYSIVAPDDLDRDAEDVLIIGAWVTYQRIFN